MTAAKLADPVAISKLAALIAPALKRAAERRRRSGTAAAVENEVTQKKAPTVTTVSAQEGNRATTRPSPTS